jgi:hypothetical protein
MGMPACTSAVQPSPWTVLKWLGNFVPRSPGVTVVHYYLGSTASISSTTRSYLLRGTQVTPGKLYFGRSHQCTLAGKTFKFQGSSSTLEVKFTRASSKLNSKVSNI